jgi:hypothetical protein
MNRLLVILLLALPYASIAQGFAVVELFTSQGCSSCPAADKNLTELLKKSDEEGTAVFALSFHVDYWNHIGWKDPYSSKESTERQRNYAEVMNLSSLYTPQMIVNGTYEFVGSDLATAKNKVAAALKEKHTLEIQISNIVVANGIINFDYALTGEAIEGYVNAAIVRHVENFVPRGENKGKNLHHDNVVINFIKTPLKKNDHVMMKVAAGIGDSASLILYAQGSQLEVLAATSSPLR